MSIRAESAEHRSGKEVQQAGGEGVNLKHKSKWPQRRVDFMQVAGGRGLAYLEPLAECRSPSGRERPKGAINYARASIALSMRRDEGRRPLKAVENMKRRGGTRRGGRRCTARRQRVSHDLTRRGGTAAQRRTQMNNSMDRPATGLPTAIVRHSHSRR